MLFLFFTGATGGLGELCVKALSDTGNWKIFAAGTNDTRLEELGKLRNVIPVKTDITDQESLNSARRIVESYTQVLGAVINFAGVASFSSLIEGNCIDTIEKMVRINLLGTARVNRTFFDMIHKEGGRIINCSSESGWMTPQPFNGPYTISKYALEAYNDSLRREVMHLGVPVIKIQPGFYKTKLTGTVLEGFDKTLSETGYHRRLLNKMKPLMLHELNPRNNPQRLVDTLLRALNSKHPRIRYRIGTGKLLALMEILPDRWLDWIYQMILKDRKWKQIKI